MWTSFLIGLGNALLPFFPSLAEKIIGKAPPVRVEPKADAFDDIDAATKAKIAENAAREATPPPPPAGPSKPAP